jgi:D-cysteine desulfhydrase
MAKVNEGPGRAPSRSLTRRAFVGAGIGAASVMGAAAVGGGALSYFLHRINRVERFPSEELARLRGRRLSPLLERYPGLARTVPWRPLASVPTPVEALPTPDGAPDIRLLVKRDDLTSALYGGNKVRKLEHLLAEAELAGSTSVVTVGGIGSNHGLATALHARELGLETELSLFDQPVTEEVRRNLRGFLQAGATLHYAGGQASAFLGVRRILDEVRRRGGRPHFINVGGTSRLGVVGYITAALELADQVRRGELPEPDRIFVALGTCGTAAGLVAGLRMAGLGSRVSSVRVTGLFPANGLMVRHFARDAAAWLSGLDPDVPRLRIGLDDFEVHTEHLGPDYGVPTAEAEAALRWASPRLTLETTYTAKTMAACLQYCRERAAPGENVLFWHTYSSASVPQAPSLEGLPPELESVFAEVTR